MHSTPSICFAVLLLTLLGAKADKAGAQVLESGDKQSPWAAGVSIAEQNQARALFHAGNRFFEASQYAQALTHYHKALARWDHPAIHYNAGICQIHMNQPESAYRNFIASLRYGEKPLGPEKTNQANTYLQLLRGQLVSLTIHSADSGAVVSLDGVRLFVGPGTETRMVKPGRHQIVASKDGYLTEQQDRKFDAGTKQRITLRLVAVQDSVQFQRRWRRATPWWIVGSGLAVASAGVPMILLARNNFDDYDAAILDACPQGCTRDQIPSSARNTRNRAEWQRGIGIGLFVVGGAATVWGATMAILNQPRTIRRQAVQTTENWHIIVAPPGIRAVGSF